MPPINFNFPPSSSPFTMRRYNPFLSHSPEQSPQDSSPRTSVRKYLFPAPDDKPDEKSTPSTAGPSSLSPQPPLHHLMTLVDNSLGPVDKPLSNPTKDRLLAQLFDTRLQREKLLSQFLRARQHDASDALAMILNTLRWRKTLPMESYIADRVVNMVKREACFPMHVISHPETCKQPVVYGLIRLLDKRCAEKTAFQSALLSFLESIYYADVYAVEDMVIILDFRDWSIRRNAPYRLVKDGIQTLQDYYPERLGRVFLLNYPTSIRAAYTAISPIIDAGAKEKIVWIPDDPATVLTKFIPANSIPTFMGGQLQATFPPTWPDIASEFQTPAPASYPIFGQ